MKIKNVYVVISIDNNKYLKQTWASADSLKLYTFDSFIVILMGEVTADDIACSEGRRILGVVDEIVPQKYFRMGGAAA